MGGTTFMTRASGASAADAFAKADSQAKYDHGHAGYSRSEERRVWKFCI